MKWDLVIVALTITCVSIIVLCLAALLYHQGTIVYPRTINGTCTMERFPKTPHAVLVIRCYNEEGGMFWHLHNLIMAGYVASKYNMQLAVVFDRGYYVEKNPKFLKEHMKYVTDDSNWFHYYFESLGETLPEVSRKLSRNRHFPSFGSVTKGGKRIRKGAILEFTRKTFESLNSQLPHDMPWKNLFETFAQRRPHVSEAQRAYFSKNMEGAFNIGIHWRGTDKYSDANDDEDGPRHFEYTWMSNLIRQHITNLSGTVRANLRIFVCTDESQFVDHMRAVFKDVVHFTGAIRSTANTGGLHLDGSACRTDHDYATIDSCKQIRQMQGTSVHRGHFDKSSYVKGLDVILDVLLLAQCSQLFLSRGNVSSWAKKLTNGTTVDMVQLYEQQ